MINIISYTTLDQLVTRKDFKNLKINDNQELLNFLLNNQLITFDEDKLNLIRGHPLVSSLLRKGDFIVGYLESKSIKEVQEKVKNLPQEILKADLMLKQVSQNVNINYDNKNRVQRLECYAIAAVVENIQENRLPNPSLSSVRTTCTETSRCVIS